MPGVDDDAANREREGGGADRDERVVVECGGLSCARNVEPTRTSGTASSGTRRSQTRAPRRSGRTLRGGKPRIVSTFSATASRSSWRFTRSSFPSRITRGFYDDRDS